MGQSERIMDILWMFLVGVVITAALAAAFDMAKEKAYMDGRRAGYARAIADTSNRTTK